MKRFLIACTLLGLLCIGCGAPPQDSPPFSSEATPATSSGTVPGFPLTLSHRLGTITLNAPPQRVVALGVNDIDTAVALGITPVAINADPFALDGISPWLQGRIDSGQTNILPASTDLPFDEIAALKPDLILATGQFGIDNAYAHLSEIAPTLADQKGPRADTWQAQTLAIGEALGKTDQAKQLIADTEKQIAAIKQDNPGLAGKTFSLSYVFEPTQLITVNATDDFAVQFFRELGLTLPSQLTAGNTDTLANGVLTPDQINLIDADLILIAFDTRELEGGYKANANFQALSAVQKGTYLPIDLSIASGLRTPSVLSIPFTLEELRPLLEKVAMTN